MPKTDEELIVLKLHDLCAAGIVVHTGVQFVLANDAHESAVVIQRAWRKHGDWAKWAEALLAGYWMG